MFTTAVIRHTVKLQAREVGANVREVVEDRARSLLEGVCGESGYVRPSSLRLVGMSHGRLGDIDMGKSYSFDATFKAEVCNPVRGLRMNALVRSINRFGMLCEGGYYDPDNSLVPVIEVVVVRNPSTIPNEVDLNDLQIGDEVGLEILGRNFELRDSRISAFGRTVRDHEDTPVLRPLRGEGAEDGGSDAGDSSGDGGSDADDPVSDVSDGESEGEEEDVDADSDYGDGMPPHEGGGDEEIFAGMPDVDVDDEGFDVVNGGDDAAQLSGDDDSYA
eukprot:jgi/Tetstr1/464020/TSEL_008825.t1